MKKKVLFLFFFVCLKQIAFAETVDVNGIFFTSRKEELSNQTPVYFKGIRISDLWVPNEEKFVKEMQSFLDEPLDLELIEEIKQKVVQFYQERDFPIVKVMIPAGQDITFGILRVIVIIGHLDKVKAEGAKHFSNEWIAAQIRTNQGGVIQKSQLLSDLEWINHNPFRKTDMILEPGDDFGQTDIVLKTKDRFPMRVYGGYENTGNNIAGSSRFLTGLNWANPLGHQLNYLFLFAPNVNEFHAHTGSYIIPLPWRHILEAYASYTRSIPSDIDENFNLKGKGWQLASRYKIPFQIAGVKNVVFAGFEFKRSNNFLTFSDILIFDTFLDVDQFLVGYELDATYSRGKSFLGLIVYLSPGNMTSFNRDRNFMVEREGAKSRYVYGKLRFDQVVFFTKKKYSWVFSLLFQKASVKLLPSEQFSLGGFFTVRGYKENEVIGDNGVLVKNEIHSPPICLPPKKENHELQFLVFLDFGWVNDVDQNILSKNATIVSSAGPGITYHFNNYITARFDYGWQLKDITRIEDPSKKRARAHFSIIAAY